MPARGLCVRGASPFDKLLPLALEAWIASLMELLDVLESQ